VPIEIEEVCFTEKVELVKDTELAEAYKREEDINSYSLQHAFTQIQESRLQNARKYMFLSITGEDGLMYYAINANTRVMIKTIVKALGKVPMIGLACNRSLEDILITSMSNEVFDLDKAMLAIPSKSIHVQIHLKSSSASDRIKWFHSNVQELEQSLNVHILDYEFKGLTDHALELMYGNYMYEDIVTSVEHRISSDIATKWKWISSHMTFHYYMASLARSFQLGIGDNLTVTTTGWLVTDSNAQDRIPLYSWGAQHYNSSGDTYNDLVNKYSATAFIGKPSDKYIPFRFKD
jgi:hypothetical protein